MKTKNIISFVAIGLLFSACHSDEVEDGPDYMKPVVIPVDLELSKTETRIVEKNNIFAFTLLENTLNNPYGKSGENTMLCPIGVLNLLAITANESTGETLEEFNSQLIENMRPIKFDDYISFSAKYEESSLSVNISEYSWCWADKSVALTPEFQEKYKNTMVFTGEADFVGGSGAKEINDWYKHIYIDAKSEVFDAPKPDLKLLFMNTAGIYTYWVDASESKESEVEEFALNLSEKRMVTMIHSRADGYAENERFAMTRTTLPYLVSQVYDMYFILAKEENGNDKFTAAPTYADWKELTANFDRALVEFSIPQGRPTSYVNLNNALKKCGFSRMFDSGKGLESMMVSPQPVTEFVQKMELIISPSAESNVFDQDLPTGPKKAMALNRPFYFVIVERSTNAIFIMGRVASF